MSELSDRDRSVAAAMPVPVVIASDAESLYLNPAARRFFGLSDEEEASPEITTIFSIPAEEGNFELEFTRRDGSFVIGDVAAGPPAANRIFVIYDITGRRRDEDLLYQFQEHKWQLQKFEALGKLAGGIAHDFNNLLAVILLQTDMLNLRLPQGSPLRSRVDEIRSVANSAAEIVRELLAFGRIQPMRLIKLDLNQMAGALADSLRRSLIDAVDLELELAPDLAACLGDPDLLAKALSNIARNAADAMPDGGRLSIVTENIVLDRDSIRHRAQPVGPYVQLTVADTGRGMDAETAEQIFEPFVSSKIDKSAGLGLATVYGIVKQSGGFIWVESELGKGTRMILQFPTADRPH